MFRTTTLALALLFAAGTVHAQNLDGRLKTIAGTTNENVVHAQLKHRQLSATVLPFKTRDEALAALEDGKVDAFASDKLLLVGAGGKARDQKALLLLPDELSFEPYGIVLPRGDAAFRLAVNTGLAQIYSSGEIVEIFGRWFRTFGEPGPVIKALYILGAIPE